MGPLHGIKIIEFGAIGPGPFCAMMLSDMGAEVLRLDRIDPPELGLKRETRFATLNRGRRSVAMDLKADGAAAAVLRLVAGADALIEGFRPGVMERLGLGPEACLSANPRLVYGRITGWGQDGPLAQAAGHDINYLAISGALHCIGREGQLPAPPQNFLADMAGGGMYLAFGVVCALLEARASGKGQVVDAAMVDGVASLLTSVHGLYAAGLIGDRRGENHYDGGAPWYDSYAAADGALLAVGAIEGRFYGNLLKLLGLAAADLPDQHDRAGWPVLRARFAAAFRTKTRAEWLAAMAGQDVCVAPVLTLAESLANPHLAARGTFIEVDGVRQPAPAPRFSRTVPDHPAPPPEPGAHTDAALADWGFCPAEISRLRTAKAIA
ncbi:CaiB/BaiF CoA transferase family protein [Aquabacter spiritensis]|uniref:Alpha-methylacyl-CoA racemase n=1 Tax=Aquabacter spiritensis TaxID=933073 RepID=A0A4R3LTF6_9HYPH|nr:CaiB/BaiF CoA-transferase family protein [Aquabacter spiritensis]TCT03854.1 alpha-methylacyl-CoA racemase [Aquabacter spiritensis]